MYKYEVDFWNYLTACRTGKPFYKKMFKIFCLKHRFKIRFVKFFFGKFRLRFNYHRRMAMKKLRKIYVRDYIVHLHKLLRYRVYYGDMTIKKFSRYLKKVNTRRGDFVMKIYFLLESRLDILLFRLNFVKTPRDGRKFIKSKKIKINDKIVNKLNFQMYLHDIISFEKNISKIFFNNLYSKFLKEQVIYNYPKYIQMDYKLMKCMFINYPSEKTIPTTFKFERGFLGTLAS